MDGDLISASISAFSVIISSLISVFGTLIYTKRKKNKTLLSDHTIHVNIAEYTRKIQTLDLEVDNPGRRLLISNFLVDTTKIWIDPCKEFSEKIDECSSECSKCDSNCNKAYEFAMELLNQGLDYNHMDCIDSLSFCDREAYSVFQTKFSIWHEYLVNKLVRKTKYVCLTYNYENCEVKGSRILEAVEDFIVDTINDASYTIVKLNGELTGKSYKGHIL